MANDKIEHSIHEALLNIEQIAVHGGYREKVECLNTLAEMTWFDNFGADLYHERLRIVELIAEDVQEKDVPETLQEEIEL